MTLNQFIGKKYIVAELENSGEFVHVLTEYICTSLNSNTATATAFRDKSAIYAEKGNLLDLVNTFFIQLSQQLTSNTQQTVTAFSVLFSLINHMDTKELHLMVQKICSFIVNIPGENKEQVFAQERLKILRDCHCILAKSAEDKLLTIYSYIDLAIQLQAKEICGKLTLEKVTLLFKEWNLNQHQKTDLLFHICRAANHSNSDLLFKYFHAFLNSFQPSTTLNLDAPKIQLVINLSLKILLDLNSRNNFTTLEDVLNSSLFHELKTIANAKLLFLHKLLTSFYSSNVSRFKQLVSQSDSQQFLKDFGMNDQQIRTLENNLRLLLLSQYNFGEKTVSYKNIAEKLEVDENDVETWVVKAISTEIVEAKLNQVDRKVTFTRALKITTDASAGKQKVSEIEQHLATWMQTLKSVGVQN